jgi:hypothetical protein
MVFPGLREGLFVKNVKKWGIAGVAVTGVLIIGTGVASATVLASAPAPGNYTLYGCVSGTDRTLEHIYTVASNFKNCPSGSFAVAFNSTGPKGSTGSTGAQGPSGVVSVKTTQLAPSAGLTVNTGGSFTERSSTVGTVTLAAGTYLLNANFVATPNAVTTGDVYPQFFVYDGAVNATFTNDVFNVGAGALEDPTATILGDGDVINSYYSGSTEITVPKGGETLDVYAFGYDSDTGEGSYVLNSATITATQLAPAS